MNVSSTIFLVVILIENMATTFKHLKHCDKKSRNILNGYIRESQTLFPCKDNSYYIIPDLVIHICLSFFWNAGIFNQENHGKNLNFIDERTVEKVNTPFHSLCIIGDLITNKMCDIFQFEIEIKKKSNDFCPYIGYFTEDISNSTCMNVDYCPGCSGNKPISVGMAIHGANRDYLYLYDKDRTNEKIKLKSGLKPIGDRFMLEFDFKKMECFAYYNNDKFTTLKLETKFILPVISLYFVGEVIQISKYEFDSYS